MEITPLLDINRKHLEVRGCWGVDFSPVWRAMEMLARLEGRFDWTALVSRRYGLEETGQALADVEAHAVVKTVVVP